MRKLIIIGIVFFMSGCVSLHKEDDIVIEDEKVVIIPQREKVDETVIETPLPFEVAEQSLKLFLDDLKFSVESYNWNRVIMFFDQNDYENRKRLGVTQSSHIMKGFNLDGQSILEERENDFTEFSRLNNIRTFTYSDYKQHETVNSLYIVNGILKQYSGPDRRFQIYLYKSGNSYSIIPPSS